MLDDVMEKIEDTFEDVSGGIKKIDKKKLFMILCIGVGIVALIVYRNKKQEELTSDVIVGGIGAGDVAYTGSTGTSGGSASEGFGDLVDEYNDTLSNLASEYNNELHSLETMYANQLKSVSDSYSATLKESETYYADQMAMLDENVALLQSENESLRSSVGSYDKSVNYTSAIKDLMSGGASGSSAGVSELVISRAEKIADNESLSKYTTDYDKNVDYMAAINKAKSEGASQEVIDVLTAQREAKIRGENLTQYMSDITGGTSSSNSGTKSTTSTNKPVNSSTPVKENTSTTGTVKATSNPVANSVNRMVTTTASVINGNKSTPLMYQEDFQEKMNRVNNAIK